jgi:hypothetical protein
MAEYKYKGIEPISDTGFQYPGLLTPAPQPVVAPSPMAQAAIDSVLPGAQPTTQTPLAPPAASTPSVGAASPGEYVPAAMPSAPLQMQNQMPVQMTVTAPGSSSQTSSKSVPEQYLRAQEEANQAARDAVDAQAKLEQAKANETARLLGEQEGAMKASYDRQSQLIQQKQQAYDTGVTQYQSTVQKYSEAKLTDPKEGQSLMQRIGSAIAVGLGAYGAAVNRTSNFALDIINDGINRNIAQQKFQIEKLGVEAASKRGDLARLQTELGNADLAERAYRSTLMEKTKMQIDQFAAKSASSEVKVKADALKAQIGQAQAAENAKAHEIINTTASNSGSATYTTLPTGKTTGMQTPLGTASTETGATKLRDAYANYIKGKGSLDNFDKYIGKIDIKNYTPGKQAGEFNNAKDEIVNVLRVLNELGTLQQGEYDRLSSEIGGIKSPATLQGRANGIRSRLERDVKATQAAWSVEGQRQSPEQGLKNKFGFTGG